MEIKFYRCNVCGNIIYMVDDHKVNPVCCNEPMELLKINTKDEVVEKHLPKVKKDGNKYIVQIGSDLHPMNSEHYIQWLCMAYDKGVCFKYLNPDEEPIVTFNIHNDEPRAVYAYCNVHGLWKKDL